jgi:hypothetical protein
VSFPISALLQIFVNNSQQSADNNGTDAAANQFDLAKILTLEEVSIHQWDQFSKVT